MDSISAVDIIDGSQYEVSTTDNVTQTPDFDSIYEEQTRELTLDEIFDKVSQEYGVDVNLLKAVAQAESGFDTNAVSYCGAMGIMQLMPATAQSLGVDDPFDAEQCITGGAKMLGYLLDDYNGNVSLALAAYNAGSGSVQKYNGVPPYDETINYINKINDILAGALSGDSWTIDGSSATDLSEVTSESAPDVSTGSNSIPDEIKDAVMGTGNVNVSISYPTVEDMLKAKAYESSYKDSPLFKYEDYDNILNTYKEAYKAISDIDTADSLKDGSDNNIHISDDYNQSSISESGILEDDKDNKENTVNNGASGVGDTIDEVINNSSLGSQGADQTLVRSIFEAQAAVISPVVAKLYNN